MVMLCVLSATENHNICFVSTQFEALGGSVQRKFYKDQDQRDPYTICGTHGNALEIVFFGTQIIQ